MATARKQVIKPRCLCCAHPKRHEIEMAHIAGCSLDAISKKFSTPDRPLNRVAIHRHIKNHLDEIDRASYLADIPLIDIATRAAEEGMSLLTYFGLVRSTVIKQMLVAAGVNDGNRTAVLAGRAVEVLREIGKITGELSNLASLTINANNSTVINMNAPIFVQLQTMIIEKLEPWPEAMACLIEGLQQLESGAFDVTA